MKGTVKFFNASKGFGFIQAEDGNEYFVHQTGLKDGVMLRDNDQVVFDVENGERGPKAINVSLEGSEE
jgi:cold shock protein